MPIKKGKLFTAIEYLESIEPWNSERGWPATVIHGAQYAALHDGWKLQGGYPYENPNMTNAVLCNMAGRTTKNPKIKREKIGPAYHYSLIH